MNREGDSDSSDPRTGEVSNKPASGRREGNKMRYSASFVHFSFGTWTVGHCRYYVFSHGFKRQQNKLLDEKSSKDR